MKLTNLQRDELIEQFCEIVVDNMSHGSLVDYCKEEMANYHDKLSDNELIEHIDCYDPELYDELVDNVTQQYAKQDVNNPYNLSTTLANKEIAK
tara:strand:+ start:69 stop:350 length:282 start_codon:yes stop_codon:yes gene_type:complete